VKTSGSVDFAEDTAYSYAYPKTEEYNPMNYMDISGYIHLKPGTKGVRTEWNGTAPESGSKPVGTARFNVHIGHDETLKVIEKLLREEGYVSHADHIADK